MVAIRIDIRLIPFMRITISLGRQTNALNMSKLWLVRVSGN
jgi:hypothetical protein